MHFYSNVENKKVESIILLFIQRLFPHNINCKGGVPGEKKEKKKIFEFIWVPGSKGPV